MRTKRNQKSKKNHEKKHYFFSRKNREILFLSVFFVGLFFSMSYYLLDYVKDNQHTLMNNSYNERQALLAKENVRGSIYDCNGNKLAYTEVRDQYEKRIYPTANLFSHVVGFSTKGKTGIEDLANYYLIHSDIPLNEKVENDLNNVKNPGNDVYTTLNQKVQQAAYDSLGLYKSACIVTNVKTGEIIAMVSKPDFDPNTIVEDWEGYVEDEKNKGSAILLNRATQGIYPPGSTFKIVTALEYLKENNHDASSYHFNCNGKFKHGDTKIQCYHGSVHGSEDLKKAFAKSCNSAFASIGVSLNRDLFGKTLDDLLFNKEIPFDLIHANSILQVDQQVNDDDMIQISIGQGKAGITPLHLNLITCAIANDGVLMKPQLIDRIKNANGSTLKSFSPEVYDTLMTKEDADALTELMVAVVEEGTAKKLKSKHYQAAGKTGSAEYNQNKLDSHAWFTGFAPADDPEIAVTIIIEGIGSGGDYAAPIAKRIFDAYFGVMD